MPTLGLNSTVTVTFDATPRLLKALGADDSLPKLIGDAMSVLLDKIAEANTKLDAALVRITADIDALKAKIDAGSATQEEMDAFNALTARIDAIDPVPDVPTPPEPTPNP